MLGGGEVVEEETKAGKKGPWGGLRRMVARIH
jgi:hypothetical protein